LRQGFTIEKSKELKDMGKTSKEHEEIVQYLENKYKNRGSSSVRDCKLMNVYPKNWEKKWNFKEHPNRCDYIIAGKKNQRKVIVDVVFNEGWMETLGKVIGYVNEIKNINNTCKVWLVFNTNGWVKTGKSKILKKFKGNKEKYREYCREWCKILKKISLSVIDSRFRSRLKFYDFNGKGLNKL